MRFIDIMMDCLQADLKKLRNRSIVGYFALNGTLLYIFYLMQKYANSLQIGGDNGDSVEPVGRFTYSTYLLWPVTSPTSKWQNSTVLGGLSTQKI